VIVNASPLSCTKSAKTSFGEALSIIADNCAPMPHRRIKVRDALGEIVARHVTARSDFPRFDTAAMDGFAVKSADCAEASATAPVVLKLLPPAHAGTSHAVYATDTALPISTGTPVPSGYDSLLVKEQARVILDTLHVINPIERGRNIRLRGEDGSVGDMIVKADDVIHPATIGALLSLGVEEVETKQKPRFIILPTGDELQDDCSASARVYDSNGPMIAASLRHAGIEGRLLPPAPDDEDLLRNSIADLIAFENADIVMTTGGVSAGTRDIIPRLIEEQGGSIHFHGVAMRPGKPVLFATLADGRPFFGLPGNPVASLVGSRFFVQHAVRTMLGLGREIGEHAEPIGSVRPGITNFLKISRETHGANATTIEILPGQQSHRLRPLLMANAWMCTSADLSGQLTSEIFDLYGSIV
jgi:molybdopterin molybdotransferase